MATTAIDCQSGSQRFLKGEGNGRCRAFNWSRQVGCFVGRTLDSGSGDLCRLSEGKVRRMEIMKLDEIPNLEEFEVASGVQYS